MQFESRFATVSAAHVTLDGADLAVVSAGGRAHCVPAEFFALFFVEHAEASPVPVAGIPASAKPAPVTPTRRPLSPGLPKVEPALTRHAVKAAIGPTEAIFAAIRESAMTTTELTDRALTMMDRNPKDQAERGKLSASINYLKGQGRIEKRECPQTRLDQWHLVSKPTTNGQPKA